MTTAPSSGDGLARTPPILPGSVDPGLLVVGVGRSGTSIACRFATMIGLRAPALWDLMPANSANVDGYWESTSLAAVNDRLLDAWDSSWWQPPQSVSGAMVMAAARLDREALDHFGRVYGSSANWVWKDPRLTVTLPFWDRLLGDQPVLFVHRSPVAVARSIHARDALTIPQALALWERHPRLGLRAIRGKRVLVASYDLLCADPDVWLERAAAFCESVGLSVRDPTSSVAAMIRSHLDSRTDDLTATQRTLVELLDNLDGPHLAFPPIDLAPEGRDIADCIGAIARPSWLSARGR